MRQYVGRAILEGRDLAPLLVATGGVDKYQVEAPVLFLEPLQAVATMDVDIA